MEKKPMEATEARTPLVVVDIGKKSKKSIKRLRKGDGKLLPRVEEVIDEIRAGLAAGETMPAVVIVVRERPARVGWLG
jgi:hypothetical protein